jgi:hypothetical protein
MRTFKKLVRRQLFFASFINSVLWIHICFNADPDSAFYLNADPDPGRKPNADPGQHFTSQKVEFLHEKYTYR